MLRLTGAVAVAGGLLAFGVALLVTVSVLGRWLFLTPIEGDFELVKMATAVGIFAYLPFTQMRRGHIFVDTFTSWLPARVTAVIDGLWDLVFAAAMGVCAIGLAEGTREAMRSGETTMQLQLAVWPALGVSTILCVLLAAAALATAWGQLKGPR